MNFVGYHHKYLGAEAYYSVMIDTLNDMPDPKWTWKSDSWTLKKYFMASQLVARDLIF